METVHGIANKALEKARQKQKKQFDRKAKASQIKIGDTVLVKILAYAGKHKIADKFEQQAYKVVSQPHSDIPVFVVKEEDGSEKRLHRNHLLPIEVVDNVEEDCDSVEIGNHLEQKDHTIRPVPKPRGHKTKVDNVPKLSNVEVEKVVMNTRDD